MSFDVKEVRAGADLTLSGNLFQIYKSYKEKEVEMRHNAAADQNRCLVNQHIKMNPLKEANANIGKLDVCASLSLVSVRTPAAAF